MSNDGHSGISCLVPVNEIALVLVNSFVSAQVNLFVLLHSS